MALCARAHYHVAHATARVVSHRNLALGERRRRRRRGRAQDRGPGGTDPADLAADGARVSRGSEGPRMDLDPVRDLPRDDRRRRGTEAGECHGSEGDLRMTAPAYKAYEEATAPARKAYEEAIAPARKAYKEATASAYKAYEEAIAPAGKAYEEAIASAGKAYEEAIAPARKAYEEATASAYKAYEEASK